MKTNKSATFPSNFHLDRQNSQPLYRQLYQSFRDAITQGVLRPGERIPSIRNLSSELGLARGTIETAIAILTAEGYLLTNGQAGTTVAPSLIPQTATVALQHEAPSAPSLPTAPLLFQMGVPALDAFPRKLWARLGARQLRKMQPVDMSYLDIQGSLSLRKSIASYLSVSRGIRCSAEQIIITAGYSGALDLVSRTLLQQDDSVWLEDPGYPPTKRLLMTRKIKLISVPVDQYGADVATGIALSPDARLAIVSPANQSPLGVSLTLERRIALLEWADREQSWILEDDYDAEFRYDAKPLPALKALDNRQRVLYAGTFSKVLFPALRLGYLVVPPDLLPRLLHTSQMHTPCPSLSQSIVADFMDSGHFSRHIKKMRGLYAIRRQWMIEALNKILPVEFSLLIPKGGMHLSIALPTTYSDRYIADEARKEAISLEPLSRWRSHTEGLPTIIFSFINITSQENAAVMAERLLSLLIKPPALD